MILKNNLRQILVKYTLITVLLSPLLKIYTYISSKMRNKRFQDKGPDVLISAHKALSSIGVHFWLDFGTLLGVFRDGKLLPNDLDIDLGVFLTDYSKEIENAMRKNGFTLIREISIDNKTYGLEQTYELDGVTVDLFYYSEGETKIFSHVFTYYPGLTFLQSKIKKGGLLPIEQYFPRCGFSTISFLEKDFLIPDPADAYLSFHYGEDYYIPRKWDYTNLDDDNINAIYLTEKIGIESVSN